MVAATLLVHPLLQHINKLVPVRFDGIFHIKDLLPLPALLLFKFLLFILKLLFLFDRLGLARLAFGVSYF